MNGDRKMMDNCHSDSAKWESCRFVEPVREATAKSDSQSVELEPTPVEVENRFFQLLEGQQVLVEMGAIPDKPPPWYNEDKFRRGQDFFRRHFAGVSLAHFIGLICSLSSAQILKPLIFTQKSETPAKSFRRYVATIVHVACWYLGNVWEKGNPARKSVQLVRDMHAYAARTSNSPECRANVDEMNIASCGERFYGPNTPFLSDIGRDTQNLSECPFTFSRMDCRDFRRCPAEATRPTSPTRFMNQFDMAAIQFYFVGLLIIHPQKFGAVYADDEDLGGFVHFWRCIGYLLGIQDRFNFCHEDNLTFTRQLSRFYLEKVTKPSMKHVSIEYEHMGRAIAQGARTYHVGMTFESLFSYTAFFMEMSVPSVRRSMTWAQLFHYLFLRLVFCFLCYIPGVIRIFNFLIRFSIRLMVSRPRWWPLHWNPPVVEGLAQYWQSCC